WWKPPSPSRTVSVTAPFTRVARQLRIGTESLRNWLRQHEIDAGTRPGLSSEERERLKSLERENRELRRANEILKSASASSRRSSTAPRHGEPPHRSVPRPLRGRGDLR